MIKKGPIKNNVKVPTKESSLLPIIIKEIKSKFGEGSIMKLSETRKVDVNAIPTGSLSLDIALGIGGLPRGRIVEIYGGESSGKTTLALHIIAEVQKKGGLCAFIDAENALDPEYAKKIGVNVEDLLLSQPDSAEQALDIVETLIKSSSIDLIVIDSVAALVPEAELEGKVGDMQIGLQARLMSQLLRKITAVAAKTGTTVIFINQIRMKIGVFFGNPETTPGGKALKFHSSIRIEIKKIAQVKRGEEVIGARVRAKVVKNKVAPPFKSTELEITYNGIDKFKDLIETAVRYGVIKKTGNFYEFEAKKIGQGIEMTKEYLQNETATANKIEGLVRKTSLQHK